MAHVSVSALQEQFQRAMFTTSILIFALIAVHAQAFALWVQSIRLTNNRISKSNYGDDITDAVPVFLFLRCSFCADRYSLLDFVPIKRFKQYKRVLKTCFVLEKRFRWNESRLSDGAQAVGDTFKSFIQKLARTCQVDADEAFSRFAVH